MRRSREQGLTLIGLAIVLGLIAFFTLLILKIAPIYMEHYKVVHSLESLKKDAELSLKSKREIIDLLEKRFDINMVKNVSKDDIRIARRGDSVEVQIAYEVVQPIMGNLAVLVYFDDAIEVDSH